MDLREKIGQLFCVGFPGDRVPDEYIELVKEGKCGNTILFSENVKNKAQLKGLLKDVNKLIFEETGNKPLIAIDEEGGIVTRVPFGMPVMPSAMAQGDSGDLEDINKAAKIMARELKSLGINFNMGPVADVNIEPENPVIGVRSFGDNAEKVSRCTAEIIKAYNEENILSSPKHFPGHGDTKVDSHLALPLLDKSLEELEKVELVPYKKLIEEKVPAIMISHMMVPALEKEKVPSTMSQGVISYLKNNMGFKGLIVTDCMEMDAIKKYFGTPKGAVAAIKAGIDMVTVSHTPSLALESIMAVEEAVKNGEIPEARINEAYEKVMKCKERFIAEPLELSEKEEKDNLEFSKEFLKKTIVPLNGEKEFKLGSNPIFLMFAPKRISYASDGEIFALKDTEFLAKGTKAQFVELKDEMDEGFIKEVINKAKGASSIVLGTLNSYGNKDVSKLIKELEKLEVPMAHAALTNPYDLKISDKKAFKICLYEYSLRTVKILNNYLIK